MPSRTALQSLELSASDLHFSLSIQSPASIARMSSRRIAPTVRTSPSEKSPANAPEVIRPGGVLSRPTLVCLLILTILAVLGALYVGKDVILPLVLAVLLK